MVRFELADYKPTHSLEDFEFLQDPKDKRAKLGTGSFATVKLAKEKKSGNLFALKLIDTASGRFSKTDLQNLRGEIDIHRRLDHPYIVKFHGYIQQGDAIYLILDYAENGNLYTYLRKKKILPETEIFRFFHQTCLALDYLHQSNIVHRDIKPENLLLDKNFNIKLCDFGWSTYGVKQKRDVLCGTYEYMAPEIVYKRTYDYKVDIWALGVLLYELMHNKAPYRGQSFQDIKRAMAKDIVFNPNIQNNAKALVLNILQHDPEQRMLMNQLLRETWVKDQLRNIGIIKGQSPDKNDKQELSNQKRKIFEINEPRSKHVVHMLTESVQHLFKKPNLVIIERTEKEKTEKEVKSSPPMEFEEVKEDEEDDKSPNMTPRNAILTKDIQSESIPEASEQPSKVEVVEITEEMKSPAKKVKIFDQELLTMSFHKKLSHAMDTLGSRNGIITSPIEENVDELESNTQLANQVQIKKKSSSQGSHDELASHEESKTPSNKQPASGITLQNNEGSLHMHLPFIKQRSSNGPSPANIPNLEEKSQDPLLKFPRTENSLNQKNVSQEAQENKRRNIFEDIQKTPKEGQQKYLMENHKLIKDLLSPSTGTASQNKDTIYNFSSVAKKV